MEPQPPDSTSLPSDVGGRVSTAPGLPGRLRALALSLSILAGLVAWIGIEATYEHFVPPERLVQAMGFALNSPSFADRATAERKNASLANGILGCVLGLAMGLAGGLARGPIRGALAFAAIGGLIGLGLGVGASEAILPLYFRELDKAAEELSRDLTFPLIIHSGIWGIIGAAGGASLGLGLGSTRRIVPALVGGLIGGVLGGGAYEIIGALAFPSCKTTQPVAIYWAPRLIANLAVATFSSALAVVAILSPGRAGRKPVSEA